MHAFRATIVAAIMILAPATARAEPVDGRWKIAVTAGTLGIGPEIGYRISDTFGIRANATFFSISHDIESDDILYDANVKLRSGGAMLDLYPFGGSFRVSGGLRINGNKAHGLGQPNDGTSFSINGNTYTAAEIGTLRADTDINSVAPAVTLGWGGSSRSGFVFGIEAGALFQGSVKIKPLTITGICAGANAPADCATLKADLEAERLSVNDDIDGYKVYPILQLTLGYRF